MGESGFFISCTRAVSSSNANNSDALEVLGVTILFTAPLPADEEKTETPEVPGTASAEEPVGAIFLLAVLLGTSRSQPRGGDAREGKLAGLVIRLLFHSFH